MKPKPKSAALSRDAATGKGGKPAAHVTEDEFFALAADVKVTLPAKATSRQLAPFLGMDDAALRRLEEKLDAEGRAYIPKAVLGERLTRETICGIIRYLRELASRGSELPPYFDSMRALENSALGVPAEFTKWALKNGAGPAALGGSRIDPRPVLAKLMEIARKVPTGQVTGIEGLEEWDKDTELAQKLRQERLALERNALIENGKLLMAKDGSFAIEELVADELLWEKFLNPARAALNNLGKSLNRQIKTILTGEATPEDKARRCAGVVATGIAGMLDKLRRKIPARKEEPTTDEHG